MPVHPVSEIRVPLFKLELLLEESGGVIKVLIKLQGCETKLDTLIISPADQAFLSSGRGGGHKNRETRCGCAKYILACDLRADVCTP